MYQVFSVLILIVCVLLVLVVLVQNSKGGGLAANFAGSTQVMGVRKTADFLEKATWTLAGALLLLSVLSSMAIPKASESKKSRIENEVNTQIPANSNMVPSTAGQYPTDEENQDNK